MADKKIKLSIAGKDVTCNFGVNYFYKHFNEITGIDLLIDGLKGMASTKIFDIIPAIYFAGYKAECSTKKEEPKLSKEDFEHHVLSANEEVATSMFQDYSNVINPKEEEKPGEVVAQAVSL